MKIYWLNKSEMRNCNRYQYKYIANILKAVFKEAVPTLQLTKLCSPKSFPLSFVMSILAKNYEQTRYVIALDNSHTEGQLDAMAAYLTN
uniref:Uncharacterized protein n=1 Tax=Glossina palpalis gambiensis TaxID=67801 RepID=A0A1B0BPJ1_9MUSC